jgi:hypothetical protein
MSAHTNKIKIKKKKEVRPSLWFLDHWGHAFEGNWDSSTSLFLFCFLAM